MGAAVLTQVVGFLPFTWATWTSFSVLSFGVGPAVAFVLWALVEAVDEFKIFFSFSLSFSNKLKNNNNMVAVLTNELLN